MRNSLVVAQVFVRVLLLITSLIVLRGETRMAGAGRPNDPRGVLEVRLQPQFASQIAERLRQESIIETVVPFSKRCLALPT